MPRHRQRRGASFVGEGEIDLTPLVDCVFLLLIFFMVTTVFLHTKGLEVDMPGQSESAEEQKQDINVLVDRDGHIFIQGQQVGPEALRSRLEEAMAEANNRNIIVNADGECAQVHVVFVVDEARAVGVEGIAFAREREGE